MKNPFLTLIVLLTFQQAWAQYNSSTGDYEWYAPRNFTMHGTNNEWSFDFTNSTGDGFWHVWAPATSSILSVRNSGKVGIMESSPSGLFHINGGNRTGIDGKFLLSSRASGFGQFQIMNPNEEETSISFISKGSSFGLNPTSLDGDSHLWVLGAGIWSAQGNIFSFGNQDYAQSHSGDGKIMSIKSSGEVGIGTSSPTEKLEVNGTIRSKEVKVEASPWPDFVFKKSYNLKSLKETENYISENHHLPDMPSAAEVEANGVALGEMNAKLLQKIEELTLYLIEQNKLIEEQGKEISQLKKEVKSLK